ncbi:MAG: RluA family pseudouridine synthase [Zetaproteobacteria bacterium]|nr:MAG: RluA family pseudouridine synthase [Zetaproteobacteria bacterium]
MTAAVRSVRVVVPEELAGSRLDEALARLSDQSRSRIQGLLRAGAVTADDDGRIRAARKVRPGERFTIHLPEPAPPMLEPEAVALDILFEDDHLLVVNKPAGMVVHPSCGHERGTLVHALLHRCPDLPGINGVQRPGIVHRLDRDTSGALVVAKEEETMRALGACFARHDLERQYLAWCRGVPAWSRRTIDLPVGRHRRNRQKMAVRPDGKRAVTEAVCELRHPLGFSRLRLTLHTGRTHQIRVHLSHIGLPILGDPLYARSFHPDQRTPAALREAIDALPGQALHAGVLAFRHPVNGAMLRCVAPPPAPLAALDAAMEEGR